MKNKNKNQLFFLGLVFSLITLSSCEKCEVCHYYAFDTEYKLGERCGDEIEDLETNGYEINGASYEVKCK